jgi:hypothetical protein
MNENVKNPQIDPKWGLRKFLFNMHTGKDNKTIDAVKVHLTLIVLTMLGLQIFVTVTTGAFDIVLFSVATTGVIFGTSHGIKAKASTEPDPE